MSSEINQNSSELDEYEGIDISGEPCDTEDDLENDPPPQGGGGGKSSVNDPPSPGGGHGKAYEKDRSNWEEPNKPWDWEI